MRRGQKAVIRTFAWEVDRPFHINAGSWAYSRPGRRRSYVIRLMRSHRCSKAIAEDPTHFGHVIDGSHPARAQRSRSPMGWAGIGQPYK